jgi:hypothetical protein
LPGSPVGKVDGDRIVREFPGGRQYLYVTEDGFREEIVVDKPTFPLEKFIGKTSGTLPSAYKTSPQTAVDANGNEFVITADTKAFGDWLEGAVYPVTIDPDFSATTSTNATLRDTYPTRSYNSGTTFNYTPNLIRFDCSSIAATATATAAHMHLTKSTVAGTASARASNVCSIAQANTGWVGGATQNPATDGQSTWGYKNCYNDAETNVAWAGSDGLGTSGTDYEPTVLATISCDRADEQYTQYTVDFNASGLTRIAGWFGATNTNYGLIFWALNNILPYTNDIATEAYRPVLSVTYTSGATGALRRTNMNAQMQSLTGGFN